MAFLRRLLFPPKRKKTKSQIAVIITFIIAVMLLLSFVFINIAKVSDIKASTGMAADKGTLSLGSSMTVLIAKYIEQVQKSAPGQVVVHVPWTDVYCSVNLMMLIPIFFIFLIGLVTFTLPILITAVLLGAVILETVAWLQNGGPKMVSMMSAYTSTREKTLLTMVSQVPVTDTVYVRGGPMVFTDASTGVTFDLTESAIAGELQKKNPTAIPRFIAWYYGKRLPLVSEEALAKPLETFIENLMKLMYFGDPGDWNEELWRYDRLSLAVPASITCGECKDPYVDPWITDKVQLVNVLGPVELNQPFWSSALEMIKGLPGFLPTRFKDLCQKILDKYPQDILTYGDVGKGEYIAKDGAFFGFGIDSRPIGEVSAVLKTFVYHTMQLANMPISERLPNITGWIRTWYDYDLYENGESSDENGDENSRIKKVVERLENWLKLLRALNDETVVPNIEKPKLPDGTDPYCEQGRGILAATCFIHLEECGCCEEDCEEGCGETCLEVADARWLGDYATCTGTGGMLGRSGGVNHYFHPMCVPGWVPDNYRGDLYKTSPIDEWCEDLRPHIDCKENQDEICMDCEIPKSMPNIESDESFKAFYFQGQMSHLSPEEMTELAQAIEILDTLYKNLSIVSEWIEYIGEETRRIIYENEETKKELIYVWNDINPKTKQDNKQYHMVRAFIDKYPTFEEFPAIIQVFNLWDFVICRKVIGVGVKEPHQFTVSVARYDTDQPSLWWNYRRRKPTVAGPQNLKSLEDAIMSSGRTTPCSSCVSAGFESQSAGTFGKKKEEITLRRIK